MENNIVDHETLAKSSVHDLIDSIDVLDGILKSDMKDELRQKFTNARKVIMDEMHSRSKEELIEGFFQYMDYMFNLGTQIAEDLDKENE